MKAVRPALLLVPELARRYRIKPSMIYGWIRRGILNERHGLMRVGVTWLIMPDMFENTFLVTGEQLAARCRLKPRTIGDLIRLRILNKGHGLMKVRGEWTIAIKVFESKMHGLKALDRTVARHPRATAVTKPPARPRKLAAA
jgi:hypothetical protein